MNRDETAAAAAASLPPLREVIARHKLSARRALGQHFLLDGNLTARIVRAAGDVRACNIYEVGPGPGGLTRALLAAGAKRVVAVERDTRCRDALAELQAAYPGRLDVIQGDALAIDEREVIDAPATVVANLPYNISTALLLKWLKTPATFTAFTLMFQKEVAERLAAPPGTKTYGRLSVMTQWRGTVVRHFDIPPRAFVPPPKVVSTVIGLRPRSESPNDAGWPAMARVVAAAFGQRRKMLRSSLRGLVADPGRLLDDAGIAGTRRAEDLDIEAFRALARTYERDQPQPAD